MDHAHRNREDADPDIDSGQTGPQCDLVDL